MQELINESEDKARNKFPLFENQNIKEEKLKYTFIKGLENMAAKNQSLFLDNSKEGAVFINLTDIK